MFVVSLGTTDSLPVFSGTFAPASPSHCSTHQSTQQTHNPQYQKKNLDSLSVYLQRIEESLRSEAWQTSPSHLVRCTTLEKPYNLFWLQIFFLTYKIMLPDLWDFYKNQSNKTHKVPSLRQISFLLLFKDLSEREMKSSIRIHEYNLLMLLVTSL